MTRRLLCLLPLAVVAALARADTMPGVFTIFDDAPDGGGAGLIGSQLRLGQRQGAPELMPMGDAVRFAIFGERGRLPVVGDRPYRGTQCLRIRVLAQAVGWWEAVIPVVVTDYGEPDALAGGCLTLAVRGGEGGEACDLGLIDRDRPCHSARLPLSRYGRIDQGWNVFRIPLADFVKLSPALGLARLAAVQLHSTRPQPMTLDIDAVRLEFTSTPATPEPHRAAPLAGDPLLASPLGGDRQPSPTGLAPTAPATLAPSSPGWLLFDGQGAVADLQAARADTGAPLVAAELRALFGLDEHGAPPRVDEPNRADLPVRIELSAPGVAWWRALLGRADQPLVDASALVDHGQLELILRASPTKAALWAGLANGRGGEQVLAPLAAFGAIDTDWRTLRLPLALLAGSNARFDWRRVSGALLAGADGRPVTVDVARARLVP